MRHPLFVLFIILFPFSISAQEEIRPKDGTEVYSIGITDQALFEELMVIVPGIGSGSREALQQQSIKPYMMPVRKVGFRGVEMSYILANCLEFYVNMERNYKVNLSPDYIALNLRNAGKKVNFEEAFRFLVEDGTVSAAIMPYDADAITSAVYATKKYGIRNYLHIFRDVTRGRQKVFETRNALMKGNPVLIELETSDQIRNIRDERTWSPSNNVSGRFPLIVVGYNELEEAFEVLSCWGSNWGNDGYMWIRYDDFEKYAVNGFVIIPEDTY